MKKCNTCKTYQALDRFPGAGVHSVCTECKRKSLREDQQQMRNAVLRLLGAACVCCGETANVFLDIDHKNGDGHVDRRLSRKATWRLALKEPDRFQILCRNCNWAKYRGGCPHQDALRTKGRHSK